MKHLIHFSLFATLLLSGCYMETADYYEANPRSYSNLYTATAEDFYRQDTVYIVIDTPPPAARVEYVPAAPATVVIWIPGCWNWSGATYSWQGGYYSPQRAGYFWREPRYMGGRYYPGRWIRGNAPRWHYSHRVRPNTYYVNPWGKRTYTRRHETRSSRAYNNYRRPSGPVYRQPKPRVNNYTYRGTVPPWSPNYPGARGTDVRRSHVVRPPVSGPAHRRSPAYERPAPSEKPGRPRSTAPASPFRSSVPRARAI
ncbi:hypothetical protein KKF84_01260 [Myxococcota bacterium]|nr:hypothetical protein [Myxococcota bacterium]